MFTGRRTRRWTAVLVFAGLSSVVVAPSAQATPTDDLLTRAASIQQALLTNGTSIETLAEQYNGAVIRRDFALRQIAAGASTIANLTDRHARLGADIRRHLVALYRESGGASALSGLDSARGADARRRNSYSDVVAQRDQAMVDRFRRVEAQLKFRAQHLDEYRKRVEAETVLVGMAKARGELLQAKQRALLASARGQVADVLRLRRAADDPDASALEARLNLLGVDALPGKPSPRAALAVAYAIEQLGKPYVFAAAGPDTFDCSGLTMMAWRQAGVSMAHFAATQFEQFPRVSVDALEPGDLVFFYPTIHHVGIYIGGGKMIHAPHTGDVVRVSSIFRTNLVGAVRPG